MSMSSGPSPSKLFLITGTSSGLGRAFASAVLQAGHRVVGTVRTEQAREEFQALLPGRCHGVVFDVTEFGRAAGLVERIERDFGPIDILINNAGYGHEGTIEESPLEEMRRQFEVNVFGPVALIKAVLPHFRKRRSGHIVNITSMGGYITMPGIGYYCGSKFALEGVSEVLAKEVSSFGIKVTAIAPGSFRTDWAGRSMIRTNRSISDYDALFEPIRTARQNKSGRQAGDPAKAAQALLAIIAASEPPLHLLLGNDALQLVTDKLHALEDEFARWQQVTRATDY